MENMAFDANKTNGTASFAGGVDPLEGRTHGWTGAGQDL